MHSAGRLGGVRSIIVVWIGVLAGCAGEATGVNPSAPSEPVATSVSSERDAANQAPEPAVLAPVEPAIGGYTPEVARALAAELVWSAGADFEMVLVRRGAVRLSLDGKPYGLNDGGALPPSWRHEVLEDTERPRLITEDGWIRLLLYVDRSDARPVVVKSSPLRATPTSTIDDPRKHGYVESQRGAWVDVDAQESGMAHVSVQLEAAATHSGWIESDTLGTTVSTAPEKNPSDDDDDDSEREFLAKRATKLRSRPGGEVLLSIAKHDTVTAITAHASKGSRLVRSQPSCVWEVVYVGFVPAGDLHRPDYGIAVGCGVGGVRGRPDPQLGDAETAPRVTLNAGQFLLDPESSTVVGCVLQPTEVADLGNDRYAVATVWGPVPVTLAPSSFEGECGTKKR